MRIDLTDKKTMINFDILVMKKNIEKILFLM